MTKRRDRIPAQEKARNERDCQRSLEVEVQRLKQMVAELRNANRELGENNDKLNNSLLEFESTIHELRQENSQLRKELEQVLSPAYSLVNLDNFPNPNQEVAKDKTIAITECPGSSQSARRYTDEFVENFIKKLDAKEKSSVDFSDFDGLKEEIMRTNDINSLPPSLASIKEAIGEIAADSTQSSCAAMPSLILFCAAIREMFNFKLREIDERKILLWRDAINCALNINFKVEFAIIHLKKIARAYFGLKARCEQANDLELINLQIEWQALWAKYTQIIEQQNSETMKQCMSDADYFEGKSLSAGLLHSHPSN